MVNETLMEREQARLCESTADVNSIQSILNNYLNPHSLSDEINEFFREIAALRNESVQDTIQKMKEGTHMKAVNFLLTLHINLLVKLILSLSVFKDL